MQNWISQHKTLIKKYIELKNKRKEVNKQIIEVSKKLNKLDEELLNGKS